MLPNKQCREVVARRPFLGAIRMGIGANGVLVLKLRVTGEGYWRGALAA